MLRAKIDRGVYVVPRTVTLGWSGAGGAAVWAMLVRTLSPRRSAANEYANAFELNIELREIIAERA